MSTRVGGVVLAAGAATRMGSPKQLLPLAGSTVLGRVVAAVEESLLDPVVVVTGHRHADVVASTPATRASFVHNPDWKQGTGTSLRCGVQAVGECEAIGLVLGDMPGVTATLIDLLVDGWIEERPEAAVARYPEGLGHPFILSRSLLRAAKRLEGDRRLWRAVHDLPADGRVEVEVVSPLLDLDTPADYDLARERYGP